MWLPIPGATVAQGTIAAPLNTAVTLTATLASVGAAGTPTGTATFWVNSASVGSCTLTAGTCFISYSAMALGNNTVYITYSGSAAYAPATSSSITHNVTPVSTATTLTVSASAVTYGATNNVLTATISPIGATGLVTFTIGGISVGTCTLIATSTTCTLTVSATAFAVGNNTVGASYAGDASYLASTATAITVTAAKGTVVPTLTTSNASVSYGTSVTLTVTVPVNAAAATGVVTFTTLNGGITTTLGTCTLSAGSCTLTVSTIPVGVQTITASYPGDTNYNAATATVAQTVTKVTPTVTVATTSTPIVGASFTLAVRVTGPIGTTPSGLVTVVAVNKATNASKTLGTCTLTSGTCNVLVAANILAAGSYAITATYAGDTNFNTASNSPALNFAFSNISLAVTTSAASTSYRTVLTFTGTLTKIGTTANPTGTITFTTLINNSTVTLGACTVVFATCSITYGTLPVGSYTVTGTYSGDSLYTTASNTVAQVVVKRTPVISVVSNLKGVVGAQYTILNITLDQPGATGLVTILDGTTVLGTCNLANNAAGTASVCTFTTPVLAKGSHSIIISFAGDTSYTTATYSVPSFRTL